MKKSGTKEAVRIYSLVSDITPLGFDLLEISLK